MKKEKKQSGPYFIALETATQVSSVALFEKDQLLGAIEYPGNKRHAQLITVMMETLLNDLEIARNELSAVVVAKGPGSYTGLRVGVSTAKGLAMALDLPLISVNSLEGIAWQVQELAMLQDAWICPMIDARRMEVYTAIYDTEMNVQQETEAKIIEEDAFAELLKTKKLIFAGNGAAKCKATFAHTDQAIVLTEVGCSARSLGKVAWKKYQEEAFEDLVVFEPFYLKDFVAIKAKNPFIQS